MQKGIIILLLFLLTWIPFQSVESTTSFDSFYSSYSIDSLDVKDAMLEFLDQEKEYTTKETQDVVNVNEDDLYLYVRNNNQVDQNNKLEEKNIITISTNTENKKENQDIEQDDKKTEIVEVENQNIKVTILDVILIAQNPELPRGCEVTSLAMLLDYAGIKVDKMLLAEQIKKVPFEENGLRGNPNDGFVGNMYTFDQQGFGVYHGPIYQLANEYMPGKIIDITGAEFTEILTYLEHSKPVWVIVNTWYTHLPDKYWYTWKTASGEIKITYKEHSVLLTGFDEQYVYFNDPLGVIKNQKVLINEFEKAYNQMGKQAISYID